MKSKDAIISLYESYFTEEQVSIRNIHNLVKKINIFCKDLNDDEFFIFCREFMPKLIYFYFDFNKWEIKDNEIIISHLKKKFFFPDGELKKNYRNQDASHFSNNRKVIDGIFTSDKITFVGLEYLYYNFSSTEPFFYASPAYLLTGNRGKVIVCISKTFQKKNVLKILNWEIIPPQDLICQRCKYFSSEAFKYGFLTCALHPSGPDRGYEGCTDKIE